MRTVVLGTPPIELERLIALRRATGANLHDEVWNGEYHMAPAPRIPHAKLDSRIAVLLDRFAAATQLEGVGPFNVGRSDNYRVPDRGLIRSDENGIYASTAALVVEILSPDDETFEKLPFYAAHAVDEVLIADPSTRSLTWLRLDEGQYVPTERSELLGVDVDEFAAHIEWPPHD